MVMVLFRHFAELGAVEYFRENVKVKHRLVPTVFAEISDIFAQIHILQMIRNKTAVATLNALAVNLHQFIFFVLFHCFISRNFNTKKAEGNKAVGSRQRQWAVKKRKFSLHFAFAFSLFTATADCQPPLPTADCLTAPASSSLSPSQNRPP
jgi:hypothetical protein